MLIQRTSQRLPSLKAPPTHPITTRPLLFPLSTRRYSHQGKTPASRIPAPTPFVPDVATFLKLIGRNCKEFESKLTSWETLFGSSSAQLRALGIEPPRTRRYLLNWRERFRRGAFGVWGGLRHVSAEGTAELRVIEREGGRKKVVVNAPLSGPEGAEWGTAPPDAPTATEAKVTFPGVVAAPHALPVKGTGGTVARIKVEEGLWEHRRGNKVIKGGERKINRLRTIVARRRRGMGGA